MHHRPALACALCVLQGLTLAPLRAQDTYRLPDWKGQWIRTGSGNFDPTKPPGLRQGAPLTPEQGLQMWEWDKRWKEIRGG